MANIFLSYCHQIEMKHAFSISFLFFDQSINVNLLNLVGGLHFIHDHIEYTNTFISLHKFWFKSFSKEQQFLPGIHFSLFLLPIFSVAKIGLPTWQKQQKVNLILWIILLREIFIQTMWLLKGKILIFSGWFFSSSSS